MCTSTHAQARTFTCTLAHARPQVPTSLASTSYTAMHATAGGGAAGTHDPNNATATSVATEAPSPAGHAFPHNDTASPPATSHGSGHVGAAAPAPAPGHLSRSASATQRQQQDQQQQGQQTPRSGVASPSPSPAGTPAHGGTPTRRASLPPSVPPSPGVAPREIRRREPKMNDILFTNDNRPARPSVDGSSVGGGSPPPATPTLGEYLGPEVRGGGGGDDGHGVVVLEVVMC